MARQSSEQSRSTQERRGPKLSLPPVQMWGWGSELSSTGPEGSIQSTPLEQSYVLVASVVCAEHQMT